jgi:5'(3')-deoxyribonucleotidase
MSHTFLLDLDGTCVDFMTPAIKLAGGNPVDVYESWIPGEYDMCRVLGIKPNDFWACIDAVGHEFWATLEPYPWFEEMYAELTKVGEVIFCTSPSLHHGCASGKLDWLQRRFGKGFRNYAFIPHKHHMAREDRILIDDSQEQCRNFLRAGGRSVMVKQIWNAGHYNLVGGRYALPEHVAATAIEIAQGG